MPRGKHTEKDVAASRSTMQDMAHAHRFHIARAAATLMV
jgi:hypothetical protein